MIDVKEEGQTKNTVDMLAALQRKPTKRRGSANIGAHTVPPIYSLAHDSHTLQRGPHVNTGACVLELEVVRPFWCDDGHAMPGFHGLSLLVGSEGSGTLANVDALHISKTDGGGTGLVGFLGVPGDIEHRTKAHVGRGTTQILAANLRT